MWLGELFAALQCETVPALGCRQALALARYLELPITTLVVNPELRGARRTVKVLMENNPGLRIILIHDSGSSRRADPLGFPVRSILERPNPGDSISRREWVTKIRKTLL